MINQFSTLLLILKINQTREGKSVFTNHIKSPEPQIFYSKLFEFLENDLNFTDQSLENRLMQSNFLFSHILAVPMEKVMLKIENIVV